MIEKIIYDYLKSVLPCDVYMERPAQMPSGEYVLIERTGSTIENLITNATFAVQSYADSLYNSASLNEEVKQYMLGTDTIEGLKSLPTIFGCKLNSDYNYTDTQQKKYRYQAVFEITF